MKTAPAHVIRVKNDALARIASVTRRLTIVHLVLCICLFPAFAQSPQAAYDQATRQFEITRRSPQNWSDIELAALKAAVEQAKASCQKGSTNQYSGEDLLAYARLCSLGKQWASVQQAASKYINSQEMAGPPESSTSLSNLATALDYEVQASLRLENPDNALLAAQTMLRTVPYSDFVSEATNSTVSYLQFLHPDQTLALLTQRQPILLSLLRARGLESGDSLIHRPTVPLHTLYEDAIALPYMQQFANLEKDAKASFTELEAALPTKLPPNDAVLVAEMRSRYLLLGSHIPPITTLAWLPPAAVGPDLNTNFGSATVLLLFPDWCNQCVALHTIFGPTSRRLIAEGERFFALLAQENPPAKNTPKDVTKAGKKMASSGISVSTGSTDQSGHNPERPHNELELEVKSTAATLLVGTPTFVVPTSTLNNFVATDFPLLIVADHNGIVRWLQVTPDNAMDPGGLVDQVASHVAKQWPLSPP